MKTLTTFDGAAADAAEAIDEIALLGATLEDMIEAWEDIHPAFTIEFEWINLARAALAYGLTEYDHIATAKSWVPTLVAKQADYGPNNILRFGHQGLRIRTWDKIARLQNLEENPQNVQNEAVTDSVMDIVGYCLIALMLARETFELPLKTWLDFPEW